MDGNEQSLVNTGGSVWTVTSKSLVNTGGSVWTVTSSQLRIQEVLYGR
jgi:hypothetical protein